MSMIFGLIAVACVLVFFEVVLPGGVLGVIAGVCVLVATWFTFDLYGPLVAVAVFLGSVVLIALLVFVEFKLLAKTSFGRACFLDSAMDGHTRDAIADDSIIGKEGVTLTRLCPSGKVAIAGQHYDAYSQDGYLDPDQAVSVVSKDNFKLIIKKL